MFRKSKTFLGLRAPCLCLPHIDLTPEHQVLKPARVACRVCEMGLEVLEDVLQEVAQVWLAAAVQAFVPNQPKTATILASSTQQA